MWKTANLTTVGYHSRFLKLTFQSMDNVIDLCSSPEDHSLPEQFRFCEQFLDELQENDVVNKVSTLQSDGKVYPLNLVRMNGQPQKRKRLSISKGHKALQTSRKVESTSTTCEHVQTLKEEIQFVKQPQTVNQLDAYFYAFDTEIKMTNAGVSENFIDYKNGLIVGLSWWGCSNTAQQDTKAPDAPTNIGDNTKSCTVSIRTEQQRIDKSTMTDDDFPVFGWPSFISKLYYLETKIFGFNTKVTSEMLEAHIGCTHEHDISNCYRVNKWMNPLWVLEREACDQKRRNEELPRAEQSFEWLDALSIN